MLIEGCSSGFISRNEFADVMKLVLLNENGPGQANDAYIDELASAMDLDKNGKIDMNEFLESFRIVHVKSKPTNGNIKKSTPDLVRKNVLNTRK